MTDDAKASSGQSSDKQKVISDIYNDRSGFGSKATTLKDSREKDKTITMKDVDEFFRKNVGFKRKQKGMNSFVAPHNNHTYQIDLLWGIMILMKNKNLKEDWYVLIF